MNAIERDKVIDECLNIVEAFRNSAKQDDDNDILAVKLSYSVKPRE